MEFAKGYDVHKDPRMINCKTQCGNGECVYRKYGCWAEKSCANYKPPICLTNADRIRSSSNENIAAFVLELLDFIWRGATDKPMPEKRRNEYRKMLLGWLKSKAEVE